MKLVVVDLEHIDEPSLAGQQGITANIRRNIPDHTFHLNSQDIKLHLETFQFRMVLNNTLVNLQV